MRYKIIFIFIIMILLVSFVYAELEPGKLWINGVFIPFTIKEEIPPCEGCYMDGQCYEYKRIIFGDEGWMYCNLDGQFKKSKLSGICENNYECATNNCYNGICIEYNDQLPPFIRFINTSEPVSDSPIRIFSKVIDDTSLSYVKAKIFYMNDLIDQLELNDNGIKGDYHENDHIFTAMFNPSNLKKGNYIIKIEAMDIKGNKAEQKSFFTKTLQEECFELNVHHENGFNIIFIAIGLNEKFLKYATEIIVDYNNKDHGIFSVEPFKSNKNKFNYWYLNYSNFDIQNEFSEYNSIERSHVATKLGRLCKQENNYIYVLANISDAVSYQFGNQVFLNGIGNQFFRPFEEQKDNWQRIAVHETGHMIGHLIDEYYKPSSQWKTEFNIYNNKELYDKHTHENTLDLPSWLEECHETAPWKDFVGNGCGEQGVVDCIEYRVPWADPNKAPVCYESVPNKQCYMEITCWPISSNEGTIRASYQDIMRDWYGNPFMFNEYNQYLICRGLKEKPVDVSGVCNNFQYE